MHAPALVFNLDEKIRVEHRSDPSSMAAIAVMETPAKADMSALPTDIWMTPTSQGSRPRPATIYEGFTFCAGDEFGSMPSWEISSSLTMPTSSDTMSRPVSMDQNNFYPSFAVDSSECKP
jgi:hypothetical protein